MLAPYIYLHRQICWLKSSLNGRWPSWSWPEVTCPSVDPRPPCSLLLRSITHSRQSWPDKHPPPAPWYRDPPLAWPSYPQQPARPPTPAAPALIEHFVHLTDTFIQNNIQIASGFSRAKPSLSWGTPHPDTECGKERSASGRLKETKRADWRASPRFLFCALQKHAHTSMHTTTKAHTYTQTQAHIQTRCTFVAQR